MGSAVNSEQQQLQGGGVRSTQRGEGDTDATGDRDEAQVAN